MIEAAEAPLVQVRDLRVTFTGGRGPVNAVDGVDLELLGWIMMGGGVLSLIIAAIQGAGFMSLSNRRVTSERVVSADGHHVVEETEAR